MAKKAENMNQNKITALYCRLSVEDIKDGKDKKRKGKEDESNSISTTASVERHVTRLLILTVGLKTVSTTFSPICSTPVVL